MVPGHPISTETFGGWEYLKKTGKREETQDHRRILASPGSEVHVHSFSLKQLVAGKVPTRSPSTYAISKHVEACQPTHKQNGKNSERDVWSPLKHS